MKLQEITNKSVAKSIKRRLKRKATKASKRLNALEKRADKYAKLVGETHLELINSKPCDQIRILRKLKRRESRYRHYMELIEEAEKAYDVAAKDALNVEELC